MGIDFAGNPVIDPTENVKALSEASSKRQDDLRELHDELFKVQIKSLETIIDVRAAHSKEIDEIRYQHAREIRDLETNRLNAITATIATQTAATFTSVVDRIAALEKTSNEAAGKQMATDPQMTTLLAEVQKLLVATSTSAGKTAGIGTSWGAIVGAAGIIVALVAGLSFMMNLRSAPVAVTAPTPPQIIYVQPAPPSTPQSAPR